MQGFSTPQAERAARERRGNLIVVPAYNEERYIHHVLQGLKLLRPEDDVLVIDDGSTDATAAIAHAAGVAVVRHPFNAGYGVTLQTGIKFALSHGYTTCVTFDADGQHEPRAIETVVGALREGRGDLIIGSRYLGEGYRNPPHKRLAVWAFSRVAALATGRAISDPTSGFRGFNRRAMRFYATDALPDTFPDADAVIMSHRAGLTVSEVSVKMYVHETKRSMHAGWRSVAYVLNMMFSIVVTLLRRDEAPGEEVEFGAGGLNALGEMGERRVAGNAVTVER